jgi:MIP family channel proteins
VRGPRIAAEAIGTFMLVFIGPGAAAVEASSRGSVGPVGVALAFGFAILAGVYALGHISGAHFNPAVTAAFWLGRKFPSAEVFPYVAAQMLGAVSAALLLRALLGASANAAATVPRIGLAPAFAVEVVLTFFLMLVIMAVATDARVAGTVAGLAVGLTVAFDALMGGPGDRREHEPRTVLRPRARDRDVGGALDLLARAARWSEPRGRRLRLSAKGLVA